LAPGATLGLSFLGTTPFNVSANGAFTSPGTLPTNTSYSVLIVAEPSSPSQTCVIQNGSGRTASANVTDVTITCFTIPYSVGGSVQGLAPGSSVSLAINGGSPLVVNANASFTFPDPLPSGTAYTVAVQSHPSFPSQACAVANGAGTVGAAVVTNVAVTCVTNTFAVGGTVTGLSGAGLVVRINGGNPLGISANGGFAFPQPLASGSNYSVAVATQPAGPLQRCVVTNGSGTIAAAAVGTVNVACQNAYSVSVAVTGLSGAGFRLRNAGADELVVTDEGTWTFATPLVPGEAYAVAVSNAPASPDHTCTVAQPNGLIANANVTLQVSCDADRFAYVANYSDDTVTRLVIHRQTGVPTVVGTPVATGDGPRHVAADPFGRFVYVANYHANTVSAYRVSPTDGSLTPVPGSPFAVGSNPVQIAPSTEGALLFVLNEASSNISVFKIRNSDGALTPAPGSPVASGGITAAAIAVTPPSRCCSLYVSHTTTDTVTGFGYHWETGALSPATVTPSFLLNGHTPTSIGIPSPGDLVVVGAFGSSTFTTYDQAGPSGVLTERIGSPTPSTGLSPCAIDAPPLGGYSMYAVSAVSRWLVAYWFDDDFLPVASSTPANVGNNPCGLDSVASGRFIYVTNGGDGTMSGFTPSGSTSDLVELPGSPWDVGDNPLSIAIVNNRRDFDDLDLEYFTLPE
jgi:6-phosphogluconolactonase (cycloisomerase 2 family)